MENQHFILKLSRLFPSSFTSCQFRTLPDVAESSITITKAKEFHPHENDHSSLFNKPQKFPQNSPALPKTCKKNQLSGHSSDVRGRKSPPVMPISTRNPKKKEQLQECRKRAQASINLSSSSNSGWFSSSDEKTRVDDDTFFSLSSNSGDSFRLKTSRRFKRCEEMKSIDETGRCSFSSVTSFDTVLSKCSRKTQKAAGKGEGKKSSPEYELRFDQISTQIYYSGTTSRRRKNAKNPRNVKKNSSRRSLDCNGMIEESYAVEKSSSDPRSDFMASMVEMIVEKQMFGAEDLERLLLCFLSLNSVSYHGMICDVFSEICQTLFSN